MPKQTFILNTHYSLKLNLVMSHTIFYLLPKVIQMKMEKSDTAQGTMIALVGWIVYGCVHTVTKSGVMM